MEFSRCIHIMRVRENDRGRGGNSKMQGAVGSVENRAPRKKPILSLSDLFLPRPVRPRSRHHELTITRYPIFAPKPRAPSLRSSRADSRKRSFIQSEQPTRACIDVCTFSPPLGVSKILGAALFLPIGCIHRWIERGTAGREPNCVEITWNSFEFLQLVKGKESMI